ncbi:MAG: thioredoxin family protein [Gemmatimonadota bacterium]
MFNRGYAQGSEAFQRVILYHVGGGFDRFVSFLQQVELKMANYAGLWSEAMKFDEFLAVSGSHHALWEGLFRLSQIPAWAAGATKGKKRNLLVIAEDWCGDASNTIPFLAHWASVTPEISLRIIRRDEHLDVMDRYLTNGSRSIPVVIVLDENYEELGYWGPRPKALQEWVMANKGTIPKAELYPQVRKWYARDRGETTLREVMAIVAGKEGLEEARQS